MQALGPPKPPNQGSSGLDMLNPRPQRPAADRARVAPSAFLLALRPLPGPNAMLSGCPLASLGGFGGLGCPADVAEPVADEARIATWLAARVGRPPSPKPRHPGLYIAAAPVWSSGVEAQTGWQVPFSALQSANKLVSRPCLITTPSNRPRYTPTPPGTFPRSGRGAAAPHSTQPRSHVGRTQHQRGVSGHPPRLPGHLRLHLAGRGRLRPWYVRGPLGSGRGQGGSRPVAYAMGVMFGQNTHPIAAANPNRLNFRFICAHT